MIFTSIVIKRVFLAIVATVLAATTTSAVSQENKLTFYAEAGIEYNDNISVTILDKNTGESDEAFVFDFSASYMALKEDTQEIEFTYDFYQSLYNTLDDFDLQIHTLSALGSWEINDFDTGLNYSYSKIFLGGDHLYQSNTLTPSLGFSGVNDNHYHRLSYAYVNKDFVSDNNDRDADQHSISADTYYFFMENKAYASLGLRLEDEDTKDPELDYQATYLNLGLSIPLSYGGVHPVKLQAGYEHYWRDYDNVTASIGQHRDDEQDLFSITLTKPIYKNINGKIRYEYSDTDSNLSSVDNSENILTFSLSSDF